MEHGGEPSLWEAPVNEAAIEGSVLPPETFTSKEAWEGTVQYPLLKSSLIHNNSCCFPGTNIFCFLCLCRKPNRCSATISEWSRSWNRGSSRRRTDCQRFSAVRQRHAWPCSRRASTSTQQGTPQTTKRRSKRLDESLSFFLLKLTIGWFLFHNWITAFFFQFTLQEEKRQKAERQYQLQKHENQMRELIGQCENNIRELLQLQVNESKLFCLACYCRFWNVPLGQNKSCPILGGKKLPFVIKYVFFPLLEWKVPHADWEWDSEAQTFGWTTQPADEGVEGRAEDPKEGAHFNTLYYYYT